MNNNRADYLYILKNENMVNINAIGLPENLHIECIKYINGYWYLGTTIGVYLSADAVNWTPIKNNSNYKLGMLTHQIYIIGKEMFIGTNNGIWKNALNVGINNITKFDDNIRIYPNPINSLLVVNYLLTKNSQVNISLSDITGRQIEDIINENQVVGEHIIKLNTKRLEDGIYLLNLRAKDFAVTKKIVVQH